jgi:hypothetical protein
MSATLSSNDAQYAYDIVKKICDEVGPGTPGSPQEKARAMIIKKELESHLGSDNVSVEEFSLSPGAFLGWLKIGALFTLIATLLNMSAGRFEGVATWIIASLAFAFSLVTILAGIFQFILYYEFTEPVFKKQKSLNVIGRLRKPGAKKEPTRLLILGGHHDSALEMNCLRYLGYGYYVAVATLFIGFFVMLVFSVIQLAGVITGSADTVRLGTIGWIALAYPVAPAILFAALFVGSDKNGGTVPGAADNLSASALAVSMCRFLKKHPELIPDDVEIRFISFGSEEAGLRGSRRYVERHLAELKKLDARLLNFETVTFPEIQILTSDVNGIVKNSPAVVQSVKAAAERAGVPFKVVPFPFGGGGTDAGSFSQAGLGATTLLPFDVPKQMVAFYHQKWDNPDVLTIEPLMNVLKVADEWIRAGGR